MKPRTILAIAWLVVLLYAWPGYLMPDSVDQLLDSRTGGFMDWHPVMMTEVWRIVGRVVSGPAGMLLLQSVLLLAGSYHLLRRVLTDRAAAIAAACIVVFPPILATEAVITPEAQLASFLVAAAAALGSQDRRWRSAGIVLGVIACGMTPVACLALLPLMLRRRWLPALAIWAGIAAVSFAASYELVDGRTHATEVAAAIADIHGTTGEHLATPTTDADRDALLARHWSVAASSPGAFLSYRWRRMFHRHHNWDAVYTRVVPNYPRDAAGLRHMEARSLVQRGLVAIVRGVAHTPLFHPLTYLGLAVILLVIAVRRRLALAVALLASGLVHELALLVDGAHGQFRDSHWLIVATALAFAIVLVEVNARRAALPRS